MYIPYKSVVTFLNLKMADMNSAKALSDDLLKRAQTKDFLLRVTMEGNKRKKRFQIFLHTAVAKTSQKCLSLAAHQLCCFLNESSLNGSLKCILLPELNSLYYTCI